jgi:hypothetical protein
MAANPKPERKKEKMGNAQIRKTAKHLEHGTGGSIAEPGKIHKVHHKMHEKRMKHSKEALKMAAKHMKKHGG